jgi:hypothetical protein
MRGSVGHSGRGLRDRRGKTAPRASNGGGARAGHASPAPRAASVNARCAPATSTSSVRVRRSALGASPRGLQARNRRGIGRRADAYHARRAQRVGEQQRARVGGVGTEERGRSGERMQMGEL